MLSKFDERRVAEAFPRDALVRDGQCTMRSMSKSMSSSLTSSRTIRLWPTVVEYQTSADG